MKKIVIFFGLILIAYFSNTYAQSPEGKKFGFGIMGGDPTGGTAKFWMNDINAIDVDLGSSYFGSPRINVDYMWHFYPFDTRIANLYAGAGGSLGFGKNSGFYYKDRFFRTSSQLGVGARGIFGVDVDPPRTPLEVFLEFGVLMAVAPDFGSSADIALGIRFYP